MIGGVFSKLDTDIITFHILPHLDGKTLIILSSVSSQFNNLICKNSENLWRNICTSTWPSLLTREYFLSNHISTLPGGYRTFFSDVFPPIIHPPPPPNIPSPPSAIRFFYFADIFLHGQPHPFCSLNSSERLLTYEYDYTWLHPSIILRSTSEFGLYHPTKNNLLNFIKVKKQGHEEYLKQNLTFSCVVVDTNVTKRAGSLFTPGCKPVSVEPSVMSGMVNVVFETLLPSFSNLNTQMVKCRTKVICYWKGDAEDKFCVSCIYSKFRDMNGKSVSDRNAAIIILNAIGNGERGRTNKTKFNQLVSC